uniref:Uncharacterized protein n=1 Tax=Mus musculus TaxID=10090 RepID=Q8BTC5_MOUSE|nr:unnamed protein product [Mus musculus]
MTENVPQSREVQLQYFSSFLPQLSPLTVFSWLNSLQDRLFCSHPQAHSLLKELYVPGIESQKSALSFSLSSLVSKFSSKVAKEKRKKERKKERKRKPCTPAGGASCTLTAQILCLWWRSRYVLLLVSQRPVHTAFYGVSQSSF